MNFKRFLYYSTILLLLPALYIGFYPGRIVIIRTLCCFIYTIGLFVYRHHLNLNEFDGKTVIKVFSFFAIWLFISSLFNAEHIYDYVAIVDFFLLAILLPSWILLAQKDHIPILYKSLMTIGVLMGCVNLMYEPSDGMMTMAHNMIWLNIWIFLKPYIKYKYYFLVLILAFFIVFYDLDRRSIMLGYVVPMMILLLYRLIKYRFIRRMAFAVSLFLPLVLLQLLYTKQFNVFSYFEQQNQEVVLSVDGRQLFVDSRTGIYEDVLRDVFDNRKNYVAIVGLGGNGKVRTLSNGHDSFGFVGVRGSQESGMLNYIQWGGAMGLVCYTLLIMAAAYYCLFKSRNDFMIMFGYFLLFKYVYSYVEDQVTINGHTYYQFLWYGMAFNRSLRSMTNREIKYYFRKSFDILPIMKTLKGQNL